MQRFLIPVLVIGVFGMFGEWLSFSFKFNLKIKSENLVAPLHLLLLVYFTNDANAQTKIKNKKSFSYIVCKGKHIRQTVQFYFYKIKK
jgi:hypothetical protein